MYYVWLSLCLSLLVIGTITTFVLLFKYKTNWPAIVAFSITLLLSAGCIIGTAVTKPEEQVKEYEYCPYCGEEVKWREVR